MKKFFAHNATLNIKGKVYRSGQEIDPAQAGKEALSQLKKEGLLRIEDSKDEIKAPAENPKIPVVVADSAKTLNELDIEQLKERCAEKGIDFSKFPDDKAKMIAAIIKHG